MFPGITSNHGQVSSQPQSGSGKSTLQSLGADIFSHIGQAVGPKTLRNLMQVSAGMNAAVSHDPRIEQLKLIEKQPHNIDQPLPDGRTLLSKAIASSDTESMAIIIGHGASLAGIDLNGLVQQGLDLKGIHLSRGQVTDIVNTAKATKIAPPNLSEVDLSGVRFSSEQLSDYIQVTRATSTPVNLRGVDLSRGFFFGSFSFSAVDLSGANLKGAHLRDSDLSRTILKNADLTDAKMLNAKLSSQNVVDIVTTSRAQGIKPSLQGINLEGIDLRGVDLRDVDLRGVKLKRADLRGADLRGADLRGANLFGAKLESANLFHARLNRDQVFDVVYSARLQRVVPNLRGVDLSGQNLRKVDFWKADLSGADLHNANVTGANLGATNLKGANLEGVRLSRQQLKYVLTNQETSFGVVNTIKHAAVRRFEKFRSMSR